MLPLSWRSVARRGVPSAAGNASVTRACAGKAASGCGTRVWRPTARHCVSSSKKAGPAWAPRRGENGQRKGTRTGKAGCARPSLATPTLTGEAWTPAGTRARREDVAVATADERDVAAIVELQTESFHVPLEGAMAAFDDMAKQQFRAEVLSLMRSKMRSQWPATFKSKQPTDARYAVIVARNTESDAVLAVCDVCEARADPSLAEALTAKHGVDCKNYVYVSCMAVSPRARRKGLATALLAAAEELAETWREDGGLGAAHGVVGLDVYADNEPAIACYRSAGFTDARADPQWSWVYGQRPRLSLSKRL